MYAAQSAEVGATGAGFAWHAIEIVGARGKISGKMGTERVVRTRRQETISVLF